MPHMLIKSIISEYDEREHDWEGQLASLSEGEDAYENMSTLMFHIACQFGGTVREGYSGRGMYGEQCWGIVHDNAYEVIEVAALHGLTGAQVDSMGLSSIVYWPRLRYNKD